MSEILKSQSPLRTRRSLALAITMTALTALALIGNALLTVVNVRRVRDAEERVAHTHQVLDTLRSLESSATDAESGQRGFLITGRSTYLEPYEAGRDAVKQRLSRLEELTRDNPSQHKQIEELRLLIAAKLYELQLVMDLFRKRGAGFEAARTVVLDDDGKRLMDRIRANVAEMVANENTLLEIRVQAAKMASKTAVVTSLAGLAANLILLFGAFASGRSRLREREKASARLYEEKERLGTTLSSIGDAVVVTNQDGRITMMNPVAHSLLGWDGDALGRPLDEVFRIVNEETRAKVESPAQKVLRENKIAGLANHTLLIRRDGTEVPIGDSGAPIRSPDGTVIGIVLVFRSIEERRKAEREVKRRDDLLQEQDRRKDAFLAMLSHELRNPLSAMRNAVTMLQRSEAVSERSERATAIIDRQITHLTRLVGDLLDVSRIAQGKVRLQKERIDLVEVVRRTVEDHHELFARKQVTLELRAGSEQLWVNADPTRIAQAAGNLLQNALKFTGAGGRVLVSLGKEDEQAVLRVRDTGVGIDADALANLFQPFFQSESTLHRSGGGLGLGLALSRALIQVHNGTLQASSDGPGTGSEFSVRLPLAPSVSAPLTVDTTRSSGRRLNVLVIGDSDNFASALQGVLELEGHEVRLAEDEARGIELAEAVRPDVIVCDLGLRGLDGYEVAERLRKAASPAVLIAFTDPASSDDGHRAHQAGFRYHLVKPTDADALLDILEGLDPPAAAT